MIRFGSDSEKVLRHMAERLMQLREAEIFAGGHLRYQQGAWRDDNGDPVDCVVVVRCKDCKWLYRNNDIYCCTKHTGLALIKPDGSDFCSYGERRADDGI